ncbi:Calx-beta domain-containing protein [Niveispirillum sp. BGYR6]|uniref:beta strand repeat-containing protein n=1 Tax=Niveispirillum sp. BGYR6 TaxID=2971249 RepID=UPI0022B96AF0|nr:Calx-beta domain-containing protein [Niveispirillum sp. BGYR6]MDG5495707.1 Calx-beta domain-containing protein [Niveispirillum sp. BGYR6]
MSNVLQDDYTDSTSTTGTLAIGGQTTGVLGTANDVDWFAVDLTAGTTYAFTGAFASGSYSPTLGLYNSSGTYVSNTISSGTTGFTPTSSGRYYVSVNGLTSGTYTLTATQTVSDDYTATTSTTGKLTVGGQTTGALETANDVDWFAVDLTAGTTYAFTGAFASGSYSPTLGLYNSSGTYVSNTISSGTTGFTPTSSGRYYVSVNGLTSGTYTLTATQTVSDDYAATTSTTGKLTVGGQTTGVLETANDADWFAIDLTAGTAYEFSGAYGNSNGYILSFRLRDASGADAGVTSSLGAMDFTPTSSGRYYIAVNGPKTGDYTLSAKQAVADDYAANTSTTGTLAIGGQASGLLGTPSDSDWFAVDLTAGTAYEFSGSFDGGGSTPLLGLKDAAGVSIADTSSSGTTGFTPTSSGRYYLSVSGSKTGNYTLSAKQVIADDYAANISTTGKLAIGGQATGVLGTSSDSDWFAVDLTAGTSYKFSGTYSNSDGYILFFRLKDSSGADTGVTSSLGGMDLTPTSSGRYYIAVNAPRTGSYTLSATQTVMDDYTANTSTTGKLAIGGQTSGTLGTANDADWFAVDLAAGTTYEFSGSFGGGSVSPTLSLYDASGSSITGTAGTGTTGYTATSSGRYYLSVSGATTGGYTLSAKQTAVDDYLASISTTGTLTVGGQTTGIIEVQNDSDWFAVDLTADSTYQFSASTSGNLSSVQLHLHNALGAQIGEAGTAGFTPTSSGRYYLSVDGAKGTGQYSLSAKKLIFDDYAANTSTTGKLIPGNKISGIIETVKDVDWFAVDLTAGNAYQFNASTNGNLPSVLLSLHDAAGSSITGTKALGATSFTPTSSGRYYLSVEGQAGEGDYTISSTSLKLPALSITGSSVREGNSGTKALSFTVSLSEASSQAVTFNFATKGLTATAGVDFQAVSGTYTIAAGSRSTVINVLVNGDIKVEGNETLTGIISQPSGAILATSAATGTILNDDFQSAFSADAYRALNTDLFYAFGNDDAALLRHYINNGRGEGRTTNGFDAEAYAAQNPDLFYAFGLDKAALTNHYLYAGKAEGRLTEGFDALAYAAQNPDLYATFGTNHAALVNHYIYAGKAEGRVTGGFDAEAYAALNPDLFNAFGLNTEALISHYINYGRAEGRSTTGFDAETYAALNPDLFNTFGLNHAALINHYIYAGKAEGRAAYQLPTPALAMIGMAEDAASISYDLAA